MSINFNEFIPRPGIINKQGRLPDPSELVCIEVPKVFDQCLIKRCIIYDECQDTNTTDCELRSNPLINPKRYIGSKNFNLELLSVDKTPVKGNPNFKKIIINYMISFYADYIDCDGITRSELFEVNRIDVLEKFYCPESIAQISASFVPVNQSKDLDSNIIKLEMVANALDGNLIQSETGEDFLDITLGYYIVVKCELIVQLLIPTYDYCPVPRELCEPEPEEDPCEKFDRAPIPKFYPDQNLTPLFSESDCESDCSSDCSCDSDDNTWRP